MKQKLKNNVGIIISIVVILTILVVAFVYNPGQKNNTSSSNIASISSDSVTSTASSEQLKTTVDKTAVADSAINDNTSKSSSDGKNNNPSATSSNKSDNTPKATVSKKDNQAAQTTKQSAKQITKPTKQTTTAAPKKTEPQTTEKTSNSCTISISCYTVLNNMDKLKKGKEDIIPQNGQVLGSTTVAFEDGETVYDVLQRVCRDKKIHMETSYTPIYNTAYIEGINNLYEFDCGSLSGWQYSVNGWFPNYGCSKYTLKDGDNIKLLYTCNLGKDIGGSNNLK